MVITNELVRNLKDNKYRKDNEIFLLQGDKFCRDAVDTNTEILYTLTTDKSLSGYPNISVISDKMFASLNTGVGGQHVICVCRKSQHDLSRVNRSLILDNIQDPGNMGTLIRSAAAFGFEDIFVVGGASPYSDKVVRSSAGQILRTRIHEVDFSFLKANKSKIADKFIIADMFGQSLDEIRLPKSKIAVIIGNEGNGISVESKDLADTTIKIPMATGVESLNAGVAGSIIMYRLGETK